PQTVWASDGAAVNDHARADASAVEDCNVRLDDAILAHDSFVTDVTSRADYREVADGCAGFNDRMWLNRNAGSQPDTWIYNRAWVNTRPKFDRIRREF